MQTTKGTVTDIQRYCIHDGPGIRTVVFFKGCPLRCRWCSNPETQETGQQLFYREVKCIGCLRCMEACPTQCITPGDDKRIRIDRDKCIKCYKCVEVCPSKALVTKGSIYTIEELIEEVTRDEQFFQASDGGVTLSGGEVLLQHEFATLILKQLKKRGINTAIETTGFGSWKYLEELSEYVDTILYDIKHYDSIIHEKFTGVPNEIIIENLRRLLDHKSNVVVRTTLIPGFNMDDNSVNGIISLLKELNVKRVDLLKFHQLGSSKYESLGVDYKLKGIRALEDNDIISIKEKFIKNGFNISIGG